MVGVWWDTPSVTGTVGTGATTLPNNTIIILSGRAGCMFKVGKSLLLSYGPRGGGPREL